MRMALEAIKKAETRRQWMNRIPSFCSGGELCGTEGTRNKHTKERSILEGNGWSGQRRLLACQCDGEWYQDEESEECNR